MGKMNGLILVEPVNLAHLSALLGKPENYNLECVELFYYLLLLLLF